MRSSILQAASRLPARRALSTKTDTAISTTFLNMRKSYSFKESWLSDSSTYPLFVCLAGGGAMAVGIIGYCLTNDPDIRITNGKRGKIVRDWS